MNGIGALVAGPRTGPGEGLMDISNDLGFSFVRRCASLDSLGACLANARLCFVLFAETADPRSYAGLLKKVRAAKSRAIRFLPVVYFCETPRPEVIVTCLGMGFDDILTMPFTANGVRARLRQQIGRTVSYFETETYFGPDRRRLSGEQPKPRRGGGSARRYEISRSPTSGITILREKLVEAEPEIASAFLLHSA